MRKVSIGLVQMKMSKDSTANLEKALSMVDEAGTRGANIVCLPELFDVPYFPQYQRSSESPSELPNQVTAALSRAASKNEVVLVGGSVYERAGRSAYNTSLVFDERGRTLGAYRKVHLPQDPCFYEQSHFKPGTEYRVFATSYGNVAVLICFDQWYPEAARAVKLMGADLVLYPTAIGTVKGVSEIEGSWRAAWRGVQRGHAIANSLVVGAANRVGVEDRLRFWGGSFVFDQFGKTVSQASGREQVLLAEVDLDFAREVEEGWGFMRNRRPETYSKLVD